MNGRGVLGDLSPPVLLLYPTSNTICVKKMGLLNTHKGPSSRVLSQSALNHQPLVRKRQHSWQPWFTPSALTARSTQSWPPRWANKVSLLATYLFRVTIFFFLSSFLLWEGKTLKKKKRTTLEILSNIMKRRKKKKDQNSYIEREPTATHSFLNNYVTT